MNNLQKMLYEYIKKVYKSKITNYSRQNTPYYRLAEEESWCLVSAQLLLYQGLQL